jgi:hypothetical protein
VNRELAKKVADAVLYEGYMLYPYRPSAIKNRQRWTFGILYPPAYGEVRAGTERAAMHSECLLVKNGDATLHVQFRFLHLLTRQVSVKRDDGLASLSSLELDGKPVESWDEGQERTVEVQLKVAVDAATLESFRFPANCTTEPLCDEHGREAGILERSQCEIAGTLTASCQSVGANTLKIVIDVVNDSGLAEDIIARGQVLLHSMLSAHAILSVEGGEFVSLLDPPEALSEAVRSCKNVGNFPVLVGNEGDRDMMLCSPILLYDYPQIAPESAGDFFDATEMDEMLTLRVMTLTDSEKNEMRMANEHARNLLERTEQAARQQLQRTHGAIRSLRPASDRHE